MELNQIKINASSKVVKLTLFLKKNYAHMGLTGTL